MKRILLIGALFLFSGGVTIKGGKNVPAKADPEIHLMESSDKLEAATRQLEGSSRKLQNTRP